MSQLPPCPKCKCEYTYEQDTLIVCPECFHEWKAGAAEETNAIAETKIVDANGNELHDGDTVIVIKDLPVKGSSKPVKAGTKVKNIRLVEGDHNISCKIDEFGAMGLKSEFVRKLNLFEHMNKEIKAYNAALSPPDKIICNILEKEISAHLPKAENKIWHAHPVWFIDENPVAGYSKLKSGIRLLFWSGESFDEKKLVLGSGKFKDASFTYTSMEEINLKDIKRWLSKAKKIQWDYKNIVKRKGKLEKIGNW